MTNLIKYYQEGTFKCKYQLKIPSFFMQNKIEKGCLYRVNVLKW